MIDIINNAKTETIERIVLNLLPVGIILTTLDGSIKYSNSTVEKMINLNEAGFFLEEILKANQSEQRGQRGSRVVELGNAKYLLIWSIFELDGEAQLLLFIIALELLGDLFRELSTVQESYCELETVFDASYDELFVTDGDGITLRINGACERHYGINAEDLIGRNVLDLEKARVFFPSATVMALKKRERVTILQETCNGMYVIATANPVFDENNKIIRVVSNTRDVTELILLKEQLEKALAHASLYRTELAKLQGSNPHTELVARSHEMEKALTLARKVATVDTTVLLLGETGTGKNALAKFIHQVSFRRKGPFINIDCGSIPQNLLESELFGYEPGAFTGANKHGKVGLTEMAEGGTLLLDEIGDLPLNLQVKLLHMIQERKVTRIGGTKTIDVNIRIIAATNRNLELMAKDGSFREDLYYRLNVVPINIPPLRDRRIDIPYLAEFFLANYNTRYNSKKLLTPSVLDALCSYDWPGNIRELENVLERLVVTSDEDTISILSLPENILRTLNYSGQRDRAISLKEAVEDTERKLLIHSWQVFHNTYIMAKHLGISQPSVVRKMQKFHIRDSAASSDEPQGIT